MKSRKIWKTVLIALGCALGAWAFGALLLPVLLPFFIGLAVSLLAEKPVRLLQTRAHVPRSLASGLCVLLLFGLLFGGLFFLYHLLERGEASGVHPVTRLDRDTFGVVILAKNANIHDRFCRMLRERQLEKTYLASVFGQPPQAEGQIDLPVYKVGGGSLIRVVDERGQKALTQYRVLERAEKTALLELHPLTGRTHQLRLHCMASGFPILGDPQYTSPEATAYSAAHGLFTQQLCAARLVFPHPMTGERMEILSKQEVFFPKD